MSERPKILVAEDNRVLADVIQFNYRQEGFDIVVANDGSKALLLAQECAFELVVSDYQMPGLSGYELLSGIRADSLSREAAFILCSAKTYELDERRLTNELGLSHILMKPFSPMELIALTHTLLNSATT